MTMPRRLVIRGGNVVDGSGAPARRADVEITGATITAVGGAIAAPPDPSDEIDASGLLVTPGFVDVHTHYDGQVTWSQSLAPSSAHGVTTVVLGNCGVGFAPCRPADHDILVRLMEGVEDIPGVVFAAGLPWTWESFPQYLDFLATREYDVDVAAYVPHAAVRVYAMGARGARREPANAADRAAMRTLVREAIAAGALGFSTSRTVNHRSSNGSNTPMYQAATDELVECALGLRDAGSGLLQVVAGFEDTESDYRILERMAAESGRPLSFSLAQNHNKPREWQAILGMLEASVGKQLDITAQVCGRAVGMVLGLDMSLNPFSFHPAYQALAELPLTERVVRLRRPEVRARILADQPVLSGAHNARAMARVLDLEGIYELGNPPDYEPRPQNSIAQRARRAGQTPAELAYALMLGDGGKFAFFRPLHNYADGNLDACHTMLAHPRTRLGLGDGGAHLGYICDAGLPTFMLTWWTRDRDHGRLPVERVVKALTRDTAALVGLHDRGLIAPGMKADLNLIDYQRLAAHAPRVAWDLPGGGRRLLQDADGYVATIVAGVVTRRAGLATGALPGRLVRGARGADGAGGIDGVRAASGNPGTPPAANTPA